MSQNPALVTTQLIAQEGDGQLFRAVIDSLDGAQVYIRRDGSNTVEGSYLVAKGVAVAVGDEVIMAKIGEGYVVLTGIDRSGSGGSGMYADLLMLMGG
jgi:hypothetical protein